MERNAHRLTLHSPAGVILLRLRTTFIDVDQLYFPFLRQFLDSMCFYHNHLRFFNHQATPSTSTTSSRQNAPNP